MSEAAATSSSPPFPALDAIAGTAWTLEPPRPWEMSSIRRDDAAKLLDGLLGRGRAPDGLTWELGVRAHAPPLLVVGPAARA